MKWILSLFLCASASAQLPIFSYKLPNAARWYPTNTTSTLVWWADFPQFVGGGNTLWGPTTANTAPGDNTAIVIWTNLAQSGGKWGADQTLHPTNFVSGGGGSSTSERISFAAASNTRMLCGNVTGNRIIGTFIVVCNTPTTSGVQNIIYDGFINFFFGFNAQKLELASGTTVTGAATIGTGYYVMTAVLNGASSQIYTNGVSYASGNAGSTGTLGTVDLARGDSTVSQVNICRVWGWTNILSAGEISSAVAQCKTDFNIQ